MSTIKSNYQKPSIKVKNIDADNILAAISVGGNTGIGIGEGEPPTSGTAKNGVFNNEDSEKSIWKD